MPRAVFLTGASGFMGRGHPVRDLVRPGAESRAAPGLDLAVADPLDPASYGDRVAGCDTFVHLVGVSHTSPAMQAYIAAPGTSSGPAAAGQSSSSPPTGFSRPCPPPAHPLSASASSPPAR